MSEPRPRTLTPEMALAAAKIVAADLLEAGEIEAEEIEDCAADIAKQARRYMNGYEIARELERLCMWSPNAATVEILDNFGHAADHQIEEAQKRWVERNGITPPLPNGARVTFSGDKTGTIDEVYGHGPAKYCVKEDGDSEAESPSKRRLILNFEDVSALAPGAA